MDDRLDHRSSILEVAILDLKNGLNLEFEAAFSRAAKIITAMPGYISHELQHCIENEHRYILLVRTLWLKMLGDKDSARKAFGEIERLAPERREKNDIIRTSLKYCVYLKGLPTESLTQEERDFMRTMAEVDAWYEAEITKAELRGEQKAKQENQQDIATILLNKNISLEVIAEATGLTIEELQQLRSRSIG